MRFLPLVLASLKRKKIRTLFTLLSVLVAFLLYGYLAAITMAFSMGVEVAGVDRLVLRHKISLVQLLPISYFERIKATPGVTDAAHATWFGGIYQDPKNFFSQMPVVPEDYLRLYPEFRLPEDQMKAWLADRTGAIAGRATADRFGWKIGDRIPLQGTIWRRADGSEMWEFNLVGIYDGAEDGTDTTQFLFRYDYFDEARAFAKGMVGWYIIRVADPAKSAEIAESIDRQFANSFYETKTSTEKAFLQSFANQVGNIGTIVVAILSAVFFTLLLVVGNTMMQSFRERTTELAVLKTLGYSNRLVVAIVLAESLLVAGIGGSAGLLLAWWAIQAGDPTGGALPVFFFPPQRAVLGALFVLLLGIVTGLIPAVQGLRLRVVDALRRT